MEEKQRQPRELKSRHADLQYVLIEADEAAVKGRWSADLLRDVHAEDVERQRRLEKVGQAIRRFRCRRCQRALSARVAHSGTCRTRA